MGDSDTMKIVVFRLGSNEYGLKVDEVREVLKLHKSDITPLPNAPSYVVGVTNIRGEITPIIDLKGKLGVYENPENEKDEKLVMVIEINQQTFGILVDGVNDVMQISQEQITPVSTIKKATAGGDYIDGIIKLDNRLIILLNISSLLDVEF
ncbi:MAG: chemotaxis protein CheW [Methanococci archaeon]|uniref:CheW protein n=1 Tax=Methanocaldococcus vulcanius (strain ATCC 700851 / DSM 12094 / M7) TaxID=579137 RepID=C9REX1_METVM|nr:chemotaxis protein CheW [Methanocaldococcus vulcanius]ACX72123.1 CheW protein [Methanocaldococcus vulcanius M7]NPA63159.1 chemotaxis protein CheW [Methanococci archaeon]